MTEVARVKTPTGIELSTILSFRLQERHVWAVGRQKGSAMAFKMRIWYTLKELMERVTHGISRK